MTVRSPIDVPALAPDAALPWRDRLLDADRMADHAGRLLGLAVVEPGDGSACRVVRAKYRLGESLRVVYRVATATGDRVLSVRAFADPSAAVAAAAASPGAVLDVEHAAVWWPFPADRRLAALGHVLRPTGALAELPGGRWTGSEVMEYAPERSITVRAAGGDGRTLGYAKAYRHRRDVVAVADLYRRLGEALAAHGDVVRTPLVLAVEPDLGILVLEAMPGGRWDELDAAAAARLLPLLGRSVAHVHGATPPAGLAPFGRFGADRVTTGCRLVAAARPDVAPLTDELALRLAERAAAMPAGPSAEGAPVLLHGDLHPKNALLDGDRVSLIDVDQAGTGPAAADLGSLVARLHHGELTGEFDTATAAAHTGAVLAAYADVRPLPATRTLRWHVAAALVVERAVRAVNRVNPAGLRVLPETLQAALRCLDREDLV